MKNIFIAMLIFASSNAFCQQVKLTLASDVWPPFTNVEGKKAFSLDIVKEALKRSNIKSEVIITDFDSVISGIEEGKFNGSAAFWKSKKREKKLLYSDAYLENQLILVGKKGSNPNVSSLSELKGKRIGIVKGYAYLDSLQTANNINFIYGESDQENLESLLSNKIDFMLVDNLLIQYLLNHEINDISSILAFGSVPLITKPLYFAISKKTPNAEAIIASFNDQIKKMIADGSYNKLLALDWIRADVDGDGTFELVFSGKDAGVKPPEHVYDLVPTEKNVATKYYINNQFYASWDKVPKKYKATKPKLNIPKTEDPNDWKITF